METLKLNEIDPIFATSFEQMIKESFAEGKHFFVAKIQSRHDQSNDTDVQMQNHSHFFNAYGILKLIF